MNFTKEQLSTACVDLVKNPTQVQHFSEGKDADQKVREAFFSLMGTDKPTQKDVRRHEVAIYEILEEVITETYLQGVNEDEFFMRFAETRNIALGDDQEFYIEDDGHVIVSEHAGNHWNIERQKMEGGSTFTIETKPHAAAVYGDFFLFLTGRLSFGRLVQKVADGIQNKIYEQVGASFASASTNLPAEFKKSGTYSEEELMDLYSHVEAASGSAMVVGTRKALAKITAGANVALFTEDQKNQLARTGRVANFNGMTLVQLPAVHKSGTFDFAYDDDKLMILPANDEKIIKIIFRGDDMFKQVADNTTNIDMSFEYKYITDFGVKVIFSNLFAEYKLLP